MGRIIKLLDSNLVGGSQSTEVYPVSSSKAIYDEDNQTVDTYLQHLKKTYTYAGVAHEDTVPIESNKPIFYIAAEGNYPNMGGLTVDIGELGILKLNNGVWSKDVVELGSVGGNMVLEWDQDVQTTRKQVPEKYRKSGMQISYNNGTEWINEQYIGTVFTDSAWQSEYNWRRINNVLDYIVWKSDTTNYWYSEPIPVEPSSKYIIENNQANTSSTSTWLDVDGNILSNVEKEGNITESPENAYFIILKHYGTNTSNTKFYPLKSQLGFLTPLYKNQQLINNVDDLKENIGYSGNSTNILKSGTALNGKYITKSGIGTSSAYSCSYIEVSTGEELYYGGDSTSIGLLADLESAPIVYLNNFSDGGVIHIPEGVNYIIVNTKVANTPKNANIYRDMYRKSESYITDFPTKRDGFVDLVHSLSKQLKGLNVFPDPNLDNEVITDTFQNMSNGTTVAYPYAIYVHSDADYNYNDEVLGNSVRLSGSYSSTTSYTRIYVSIPSKFIKEKGYSVGDKIKLGFYIRNTVPSNTIFMGYSTSIQYANFSDDNPIFLSVPEKTIEDLSKPVIFELSIQGSNSSFDIRFSKICVKNISLDGEWLGYEDNDDYELDKKVNGKLGEEVKPIVTEVFNENKINLYDEVNTQLYGQNLVNIRRKLRTMNSFGKPKDSIRIVLFADSIWGSGGLATKMQKYFNETWGVPKENIDIVSACYGGYEVWAYAPCIDGAVIQPNVDLFIFSDVPYPEVRDQLVAKVRNETNADIMIGTWTIQVEEQRVRYWNAVDLAKKYKCELLDINGILYRKVQDGTIDEYMNGVHPNDAGEELIMEDFKLHFESTRYYNEYNDCCDITEDIVHLAPELNIPLHSNIKLSEGWSTDDSQTFIKSSSPSDYVEVEFNGVGIEFAFNKGSANHVIKVDNVEPNTLGLEYCTPILNIDSATGGEQFHRIFAAYITKPFMTQDESEVPFTIVIDSIDRSSSDNTITSMDYTLKQGDTIVGTGNIMSDSTFTFRSGQIKIPAKVYGWNNWVEMPNGDPNAPGTGYIFTEGDTLGFNVRKTWCNSIDTSKAQYFRIAGLKRGTHTIKISKDSSQESQIRYLSIYK